MVIYRFSSTRSPPVSNFAEINSFPPALCLWSQDYFIHQQHFTSERRQMTLSVQYTLGPILKYLEPGLKQCIFDILWFICYGRVMATGLFFFCFFHYSTDQQVAVTAKICTNKDGEEEGCPLRRLPAHGRKHRI